VSLKEPPGNAAPADVVAATYASPAQLIAVQQHGVTLDIENTPELTVDAVAKGHASRAIVWYPALVAYTFAHPKQRFDVTAAASPYADWHLVFAFGPNHAALQRQIDAALEKMSASGRLTALTRQWTLPETTRAARPAAPSMAYMDGSGNGYRLSRVMQASSSLPMRGGFIKVDAATGGEAPGFDHAQVTHGKTLYGSSCAKCHGPELQGLNAPALKGPAFAPAANAKLTIGGIYTYMATNMPADRPGKLKDQDYADIMAFLLFSNGYSAGSSKMTAESAKASTTPLNAGHQ